jgi:hypothetical protein
MTQTATDFPDPGMIEHLRELAGAEPFKPFTIRLADGTKLFVAKKDDITFTHYGSPKIYTVASKHHPVKRWHILNVDAIAAINI